MGGMGVGLGLGMGLPMVGGALEQAGMENAGSAMSAAGTAASIGMFGGPLVAAGAALTVGLATFAHKATESGESLEKVNEKLQQFERESSETLSAGQAIIQAQEDLLTASTTKELEDASKRLEENFDKIAGTELEEDFLKCWD